LEITKLSREWKFQRDKNNTGTQEKWYSPDYDDRGWDDIRSDRPWGVQGHPDYFGCGWYRQALEVPEDCLGEEEIRIVFYGVDKEARVYINGDLAFEHTVEKTGLSLEVLWSEPFAVDAKPYLKTGRNTLAVQVHSHAFASGIYRPHCIAWGKDLSLKKVLSELAVGRPDMGWKEHFYRVGDGKGGWVVRRADYQFMHHPSLDWTAGYGLAQMDNGEIILMGAVRFNHNTPDAYERTIYCFSSDNGDTWSDLKMVEDSASSRPMTLVYLGRGRLTFLSGKRFFSEDYGRTWESSPAQPAINGLPFYTEGSPMVEHDTYGNVTKMAEVGYTCDGEWPEGDVECFIRWSCDGGRTWKDDARPDSWRYGTLEHETGTHVLSGNEGSVTRAANGWLVAALRTDLPPQYYGGQEGLDFNDSLSGTGVSISKDDGRTWSPLDILFEAGRHHAHLMTLPSGDIVMTLTVRVDYGDGTLASYRRGCDVLISRDNGLTWGLDRRIILDEYEFFDGNQWFNGECGHIYSCLLNDGRILTVSNNYRTNGISLVRWTPQ